MGGGGAAEDVEMENADHPRGIEVEEEEDYELNVDDMPVTQEDAWAVIR